MMQMRCNGPLPLRTRALAVRPLHHHHVFYFYFYLMSRTCDTYWCHSYELLSFVQTRTRTRATRTCICSYAPTASMLLSVLVVRPADRQKAEFSHDKNRISQSADCGVCIHGPCRVLGMREFGVICQKSIYHAQTNATDSPKIYIFSGFRCSTVRSMRTHRMRLA